MSKLRHQGAVQQRTFTSSDKMLVIVLNSEDKLLIQTIEGACSLIFSEVDTLKLANLLKIHYADIASSALPFTGIQKSGRKDEVFN